MAAVALDTLRISKRLTDGGVEARAAESISLALADVWVEREEGLATKADLRELKSELRAEIRQGLNENLKWTIGSVFALNGLLFAAIKLL